MATYNITKSDGNPGPAIADAASPDTQTDLQLVGQNAVSYGLDVATSFYWLLENFAHTSAPTTGSSGRATGQIWYDKTTSAETLNVYNGATWDQVANTNRGSSAVSSTLRWDNASNKWSEDVRVTIDGSGSLGIIGPTPGNSVAISHDDTDLNIVGTSTADINVTGVTAVNLPSLTLVTALDETDGGTGQSTFATGDILYASGANTLAKLAFTSNGEILTLAGGVPTWASAGAGVAELNDLTDVTITTPANNSLLYRSAGQYIDSNIVNLSFDGTTLNATQFGSGNILSANLIDRSAPGTISGAATFSNVSPITATAGDINATSGFGFVTNDGAVAAAIRADTGTNDIQFTHSNTPDWNISGLGVILAANPIHATSIASAASFRSIGDAATWSAADSYISFYDNASVHGLQIGTLNGSEVAIVNSRIGNLELYAANTLMMEFTATTAEIKNTAGVAMAFRNPFTVGTNASTSATVGDINNAQYNVGYNETPTQSVVSSRNIDIDDIGKFLTRTTSTSRALTVAADTDIPVGGSCVVHNGSSGGTLTVVPDGGQTLHWVDGSGSLPASATRTIAYNSVVTLRKVSSTVWQIWGNGIS